MQSLFSEGLRLTAPLEEVRKKVRKITFLGLNIFFSYDLGKLCSICIKTSGSPAMSDSHLDPQKMVGSV